jgi:hypothetical protein
VTLSHRRPELGRKQRLLALLQAGECLGSEGWEAERRTAMRSFNARYSARSTLSSYRFSAW